MNVRGIAAALVGVGGLLVIGGAWYTGTQVESTLNARIEEANAQLASNWAGGNLVLELTDLQRNLFSSEAIFTAHLYGDDQQTLSFSWVSQIEHGPIPLSRLARLQLRPVLARMASQLEPNDLVDRFFPGHEGAPLTSDVVMYYGGGLAGHASIAPTHLESDTMRLSFSGLRMDIATDASAEKLRLKARTDNVQIATLAAQPATLNLSGIRYETDLTTHVSGLHLGKSRLELDLLEVLLPDDARVQVTQMVQTDELYEEHGMIAGNTRYDQGPLTYNGEELGSLSTRWSYSNLDPEALNSLGDLYLSAFTGAPLDPADAIQRVELAFATLLAGNPRLSLDSLELRTANGRSELSLSADLSLPPSGELPSVEHAVEVLSRASAKLQLSRSMLRDISLMQGLVEPELDRQELANQADMFAALVGEMAVALGLAVAEGEDSLVSDLQYVDGKLQLNGKELDPAALTALFALAMPQDAQSHEFSEDPLDGMTEEEIELLLGDWQN
ncbi:YdgA family protein [Pseudomonas sp.]|uniref:YdgA family protein n=1 Tax=Pseudomonas sp. TaxID=306 RepID=UPI00272CF27A|nr:YdgA family protein [Pseudomonas sp.]